MTTSARRGLRAALAASLLGPALGAITGGCAASPGGALDPAPASEAGPAAPAPDPGWRLRDLHGRVFTLGELRGRPVFVNLWATWCPPCVAELASIGRLAEAVGDSVVFLLVSAEDERVVREFLRRHTLDVAPVLEETLAPGALGAAALPHTVILDARGRIVATRRGAAEWDDPAVVAFLQGLARDG